MQTISKQRVSILDTPRAGNYKRNIIDGIPHCVDCNSAIDDPCAGKRGGRMRCDKCRKARDPINGMKQAAHTAVARSIRHGDIKPPSNFACVDCGKPAAVYDHRNYSKPLDVEPVCRSCNVIRGPACDSAATMKLAA